MRYPCSTSRSIAAAFARFRSGQLACQLRAGETQQHAAALEPGACLVAQILEIEIRGRMG